MRAAALIVFVLAVSAAAQNEYSLSPGEAKELISRANPQPDLEAARAYARATLPAGATVIVVDDGSSTAADALALLRALGYSVVSRPQAGQSPSPSATSPVPASAPDSPIAGDASEPPQFTWRDIPIWVFATIGGLALATAATLLWVFVLLPRRRAKPLREAIALLQSSDDPPLPAIESLLNRANSAGLRARDLATARFLLAYVRARLGRHPEALTVLGEYLEDEPHPPEHVLYLDLWLKVKTRDWQGAERRWYESSSTLETYLESGHLAGLTFLELGRQSLTRKEYERALACFDKVRQLGVLADRIPGQLANLEQVLAIGALFDRETQLAQQRFERLLETAEAESRPTLVPRIGLLLCRWRSEEYPDVDSDLYASLTEAESAEDAAELRGPLALWYAVSLLFLWLRGPQRKGYTTDHRDTLQERLERVRKQMSKEGDADLIAGLLDYFCAKNDKQRRVALDSLRKAIDAGVTLPEVLYLVESEDRRAERDKNKLDSYISLVRAYLNDGSAPLDMRQQLYEHLHQFERFRSAGDLIVPAHDSAVAPSVHDVAASCAIIEDRVRRLFRGSDDDPAYQEIDLLLRSLSGSRDTLQKTVDELGRIEHQLMRSAGEALLPDDAPAVPPQPGAES